MAVAFVRPSRFHLTSRVVEQKRQSHRLTSISRTVFLPKDTRKEGQNRCRYESCGSISRKKKCFACSGANGLNWPLVRERCRSLSSRSVFLSSRSKFQLQR